jgi:hypothetical protein
MFRVDTLAVGDSFGRGFSIARKGPVPNWVRPLARNMSIPIRKKKRKKKYKNYLTRSEQCDILTID